MHNRDCVADAFGCVEAFGTPWVGKGTLSTAFDSDSGSNPQTMHSEIHSKLDHEKGWKITPRGDLKWSRDLWRNSSTINVKTGIATNQENNEKSCFSEV